jgi:hypothetical protein
MFHSVLAKVLLVVLCLQQHTTRAFQLPYGGWGNNIDSVFLGTGGGTLFHSASAEYDDAVSAPREKGLPSAREVSNALFADGPGNRDWNASISETPVTQLFTAFVELLRADLVDLDRKVIRL